MLDWSRISGQDFEAICYELISSFEQFKNIRFFKGPGDRGRDITADFKVSPFDGREIIEEWVAECKLRTRGSLSLSDIRSSLDWIGFHQPDCYLIITNTYLTPDTKDWVNNYGKKNNCKIQYLEGAELEAKLLDLNGSQFESVFQHHLGYSKDTKLDTLKALSTLAEQISSFPNSERCKKALSIANTLDKYRDENGHLPRSASTISLYEKHRVIYDLNCSSNTTYEIEFMNFSNERCDTDRFRLFADIPVYDNSDLNFKHDGLSKEKDSISFDFDIGYEKIVDLHLAKTCEAMSSASYKFQFDWPTPKPLNQVRHYVVLGRRPKSVVDVQIDLPKNFTFSNPIVFLSKNGIVSRVQNIPKMDSPTNSYSFRYRGLKYGEQLQLVITAELL